MQPGHHTPLQRRQRLQLPVRPTVCSVAGPAVISALPSLPPRPSQADDSKGENMANLGKVAKIGALSAIALVGLVVGKWYHTAALEPIDPQRGIYGMDGLEIWIDLNARMPAFARDWGCTTLRSREKVALGGANSLPPYSCQPGFGSLPDSTTYDSVVNANLGQATAGLDPAAAEALRTCFDARLAASVTPEMIAAVNADPASDSMSPFVVAVSQAARDCKPQP